jgi:glutamine synthetase
VEGLNAEQRFDEKTGFTLISSGGYFHSLPGDPLRQFIDAAAEAQRAMGNEKTARIEVRSVGPDANPYLLLYTLLQTGLKGKQSLAHHDRSEQVQLLPTTIQEAIEHFESSQLMRQILGETNVEKYLSYKRAVADRSPRNLGTLIKTSEIIYHHEITNQALWNAF